MKVTKIADSKIYILDNSQSLLDKSKKYLYIQNVKFKNLKDKKDKEDIKIYIDFNTMSKNKMYKTIKKMWKYREKYRYKYQTSYSVFTNSILDLSTFNFIVINYTNTSIQNEYILLLKSICYEYEEQTLRHVVYKFLEQFHDNENIQSLSYYDLKRQLKTSIIYTKFLNHSQRKAIYKYLKKFIQTQIQTPISLILNNVIFS